MSRNLCLLALLLTLPGSVALALPGTPVPDIETFMQIGYSADPRITEDGRTLFFESNASGVAQLYRMDLTDRWPYQLTVFEDGIDFYSLSPDGRTIIAGVGSGGNENSQLWLLDAGTGEALPLTERPEARYGAPSFSPDAATIYYRSNEANGKDFHIYRMDLESGESTELLAMEGWNLPGDVSDDGRHLLVTHLDSNTASDLYLLDTGSGKKTHLTPHEGEVRYSSAQFDATGRTVHLISNGNPDRIPRRALLDIQGRELSFLDPEAPWEVFSLTISPARDVLAWTVNEDGFLRLKLFDLIENRELPAAPLDGQVGSVSLSGVSSAAIAFSSATSTHDVWVWDWRKPDLTKATHSTYAGVDPGLFRSPELVRFESFDGLEIPAFLYLPPGYRSGEPVPFVLHMHGGPELQFRPSFIRHFQYLLLNGYGILAPNVRGSAGYGQEYMDLDNYENRLDSVKDMRAAADFLVREGYSAPGLLGVKGGSYGGYMTLAGITEYPDLFSAAIDQVGISNFVTFLEKTAEHRRYLREAEYGPLSDREFLESISPIHKADLIETPLLVVHGANDPRVPLGEAHQIIEAIESRGGVVETLLFEDEGHGAGKRENVLLTYRRMVEFLDTHLKKQAPSQP